MSFSETPLQIPPQHLSAVSCIQDYNLIFCGCAEGRHMVSLFGNDTDSGNEAFLRATGGVLPDDVYKRMRSLAMEFRSKNACSAMFLHIRGKIIASLKQWGDERSLLFLRSIEVQQKQWYGLTRPRFVTAGMLAAPSRALAIFPKKPIYSKICHPLKSSTDSENNVKYSTDGGYGFVDIERIQGACFTPERPFASNYITYNYGRPLGATRENNMDALLAYMKCDNASLTEEKAVELFISRVFAERRKQLEVELQAMGM